MLYSRIKEAFAPFVANPRSLAAYFTSIMNMADMFGGCYAVTVTPVSSVDLRITISLSDWPITYELLLLNGHSVEEL
jgi:hypothetical protein